MLDVELFSGAGGMALGLRLAGFGPTVHYEYDGAAVQTLTRNIELGLLDGEVRKQDLTHIRWKSERLGAVRLLAAGVPCQPFSQAGLHKAEKDPRNLFPVVFEAISELQPAAVLIENVRGLSRAVLKPYLDYVLLRLQHPNHLPKAGENWAIHQQRMVRWLARSGAKPEYHITVGLLNAADFGVPQIRHRIFIVAIRGPLTPYRIPSASHSQTALMLAQTSGAYWKQHGLKSGKVKKDEIGEVEYIRRWVTVRDAFRSLRAPSENKDDPLRHFLIPGARSYHGHSGSNLDWPSKTLKAGVHGVPGGENAFINDQGVLRYYTLREAARLQSFPDDYEFAGSRTSVIRQLGNAVPVELARAVAAPLQKILERAKHAKS